MGLYAERDSLIGSENAFKVGPYIKQVEDSGLRVIKCNLGEPDFSVPEHVREAVKRAIDQDLTHYCDPQGILPLREAIAKQVSETRGLKISPDRVVVFPGAKPPIAFCQQTYLNPGDEVIYPSPGFPIYESLAVYLGAKPVPLQLREEQDFSFGAKEIAQLISPKTKLIILNSPSNPTGGVASREQLQEIAEVILKYAPENVRIYSDEVYEHIILSGDKHYSIASFPGMQERTVIVSGVSKSFAWTGGRIGWAVFPSAAEALHFKNLNINYFSCISAYNQIGAKVAIESELSAAFIQQMLEAFKERCEFVVKGLNDIAGINCRKPRGTFYVFPNVSGLCRDLGVFDGYQRLGSEFCEKTSPSTLLQMFLLFRYGVATMDRRSFGMIGSDGSHYLRLSIASSIEDLKEALSRIRRAAQDRTGFADFIEKRERLF